VKFVVYHNDEDGFGAAYAAYKKFGPTAQYIAISYGEDLPYFGKDSEVYMLDYSLPRDETEELSSAIKSLTIVDHHKTAEEEIGDLPYTCIDQSHSAAVLAWQVFHPSTAVPRLLRYIEDADLSQWGLQNSKELFYYLSIYPRGFSDWEELASTLEQTDYLTTNIFVTGKTVVDAVRAQANLIYDRTISMLYIGGHYVPAVCSAILQMELRELLLEKNSDFLFTASFYIGYDDKVHVSLFSDGLFDVSAIAKRYNGGGHPHAAAFIVDDLEELRTG